MWKDKTAGLFRLSISTTQVYFVYNEKSSTSGYVWMCQAPSLILKSCIGSKKCLSLTHNADRNQAKLPDGVRHLTIDDFRTTTKGNEKAG